jgi:cytochrome b561
MKEKEGIRFGRVSIINHWTNAIIFLSVLGLGFYLSFLGDGRAVRGPWMEAHKAGGVLLLVLALWRVSWRMFHGFPKDVISMPTWQKMSAKLVHWMLLFAILAMPLSGILMSLYGERSINVFGLFVVPAQPENELISRIAYAIHGNLAYLVSGALLLHVGAVLKHHLLDKDDTLKRMLTSKYVSYTPFKASQATLAQRKPQIAAPQPAPQVKPHVVTNNITPPVSAKVTPKAIPIAAPKATPKATPKVVPQLVPKYERKL